MDRTHLSNLLEPVGNVRMAVLQLEQELLSTLAEEQNRELTESQNAGKPDEAEMLKCADCRRSYFCNPH